MIDKRFMRQVHSIALANCRESCLLSASLESGVESAIIRTVVQIKHKARAKRR